MEEYFVFVEHAVDSVQGMQTKLEHVINPREGIQTKLEHPNQSRYYFRRFLEVFYKIFIRFL